MSDYCGACHYDVNAKSGPKACPFNYLYWNFLIGNQASLGSNQRLAMPYRNLARFSDERRAEIMADAARFLSSLEASAEPGPGLGSAPSPQLTLPL
jgi:deoxyribodipyrimidine photolyase-related protein